MKHLNYIIGGILLILNIIIGCIVSSYSVFNVCLVSGIIILSFILIEIIQHSKLKSAFRIALILLYSFLMIACGILGILSQEAFQDNWYLIVIITILIMEVLLLIIANSISQKSK